jgi:endonuclease/exonuclease/phosphatase family metal-dependent hydrolase
MAQMATRIVTWNLQGRERPDLDAVHEVLAESRPDVVALQEVQPGQARGLARRLGWHAAWRCKHWPVVVPPEGLALLTPTPLGDVGTVVLAAGARLWSWRRRIAIRADVPTADGALSVVVTHLGAGVDEAERRRQAARTIEVLGDGPGCVVGDLNTRPGSTVLATYRYAGLRDAWAEARPTEAGPTNWPGSRDSAPTQRLDYVLVRGPLDVVDAVVPVVGDPRFDRYGAISDHLPVAVTVATPPAP